MESAGAMPELNWNSFNGMMSTEEAEIMTQFLGNYPFINDQDGDPSLEIPSTVWSGHEDTRIMAGGDDDSYYCSDTVDSSLYYLPRENSTSSLFMPTPLGGYESYYVGDSNSIPSMNDNSMSMEFYMVGDENNSSSLQLALDNVIEETVCLNSSNLNHPSEVVLPDQILQPKRKLHMPESDNAMADDNKKSENPKKKSRVQGDVQKNGKNVQSKKNKIVKIADEEESNAGLNGQSSSSYCSEDDSNASQELNGVSSSSKGSAALNLNGKTRAGRGSATDPQSLYARKRRERINERLRILQNLVPNGTKVDISTMLEEAVQYVKFLQLQIKLLSSDDLWMYAPIAYNGMDIGLNLNISPR